MPLFLIPPADQVQIQALHTQGLANSQNPGAFTPMYSYLNNILITGSPPPVSDPVVKQAQLWFSGAIQANLGQGPYATVIREYTQNQQRLHLGRPAPAGVGAGGLQEASNGVATNVFNDIQSGNDGNRPAWTVPTISEIAARDAQIIGDVLFKPTRSCN